MDTMQIKNITKDCARRSSLKGLPRIINSDEQSLKTLWIFGFLALFGVCIFQVWIILQDYFEYSAVMTITESQLDLTKDDVKLPNVMICNLNPLQSNPGPFRNGEYVMTFDEYLKEVEEATSCENRTCTRRDKFMLNYIKYSTSTFQSYFASIGFLRTAHVSHQLQNFITDCILHVEIGGFSAEDECDDIDQVQIARHFTFTKGMCTRISFNYSDTWSVTGISLILHLDNFDDHFRHSELFGSSGSMNQGYGALITLYEPDTFAMINKEPQIISSGMATQIGYQIDTTKILNEPFGKCDSDSMISMLKDTLKYRYTEDVCRMNCVTAMVYKTCGCVHPDISGDVPVPDHLTNKGQIKQNLCFYRKRNTQTEMAFTNQSSSVLMYS